MFKEGIYKPSSLLTCLLSLGTGFLVCSVAGCGSQGRSFANDDAGFQHDLATNKSQAEALSWLQTKDGREYTIGESSENMDAAASLRFVKNLYHCGALKVTAIDIENDSGMSYTSTLIVEMPQSRAERAKLLKIDAEIADEGSFDADQDVGQRYFMLHWDG